MRRYESRFDEQALPELEERKSKTRRKKEMIELQKLGEQLANLPVSYLKKSGIPPELMEAIVTMRDTRTHGARRRQRQHIGVIMREVDEAQIRKVLDEYQQPRHSPAPVRSDLDDQLLSLVNGTEEQIENLMRAYPASDRTRLRQLIRNAKAKPEQGDNARALQALRSYLMELMTK